MFGSIGITELVLILVIVLIIFGAGKLPQLGEGLGKAIKGFKKSVHEADAIEAEAQAQLAAAPRGVDAGAPRGVDAGAPQAQPVPVPPPAAAAPAEQQAAPPPPKA